jgi:hypothetical protein
VKRALAGSVLLAIALALAAGCGGGDDEEQSSSQAWVNDFCSAAADWRSSLEDVVQGLSPSDLSEDGIRNAVDQGVNVTESFLDDVRGLGAPDTEAGQQAKDIVDSMAASVQSTVDDLQGMVADSGSLQDLIAKIPQASSELGQLQQDLQSSLDDLENLDTGELRDELESNDDCTAARSGPGS